MKLYHADALALPGWFPLLALTPCARSLLRAVRVRVRRGRGRGGERGLISTLFAPASVLGFVFLLGQSPAAYGRKPVSPVRRLPAARSAPWSEASGYPPPRPPPGRGGPTFPFTRPFIGAPPILRCRRSAGMRRPAAGSFLSSRAPARRRRRCVAIPRARGSLRDRRM